jgi:hypothetical protein
MWYLNSCLRGWLTYDEAFAAAAGVLLYGQGSGLQSVIIDIQILDYIIYKTHPQCFHSNKISTSMTLTICLENMEKAFTTKFDSALILNQEIKFSAYLS